ncbi:helix-turn-helix transcriptional regulator [Staphylococcus sp. CWZ226]|uniref:helix-turn-helix domain-containing protein n=1 Tax=Staphylococcus sp. CWZ226 TaxID=2849094 RepID=UPI001C1EBA2B|nr:helix-turn-helix transcriptional regulator [Staphylococcus sp. CWZ226]MBU6943332.1 helix-turn-helix transcriptional regulator [Staphylococcus sp. CWZ226]
MIKSRLSILMAERGLKIADLYEDTGISKTTLMAISENTGKGVQYDTIDKLCIYLGVTPCEFFDYAPFQINISQTINSSDEIGVNVKTNSSERTYYLTFKIESDSSDEIFIEDKNITHFITIDISEKNYSEELFDILDKVSISFITEIKRNLIDTITLILKSQEISERYNLRKGNMILISIFKDTEYEVMKRVSL